LPFSVACVRGWSAAVWRYTASCMTVDWGRGLFWLAHSSLPCCGSCGAAAVGCVFPLLLLLLLLNDQCDELLLAGGCDSARPLALFLLRILATGKLAGLFQQQNGTACEAEQRYQSRVLASFQQLFVLTRTKVRETNNDIDNNIALSVDGKVNT
jgi:hypothetical protein